jgi:enamine deaminase RidA (YjgF/YER057c/UK114 family)
MAASVRFINPKTLAKPPGYTYVVETSGPGRTVYVAGQLGLDLDNKLVGGPGEFRPQATKAFENLQAALAAVGAGMKDVVKINNYLTDIAHIGVFREVRDQFVNVAAAPASTTVVISELARPGALFEIEAIAVLPPAKAKAARARGAKVKTRAKTKPQPKSSRRKRK